VILTASRSNEVRSAEWNEFDAEAKVWTVPATRMKTRRPHRVPLCGRAVAILEEMGRTGRMGLIFPGPRASRSCFRPLTHPTKQNALVLNAGRHGGRIRASSPEFYQPRAGGQCDDREAFEGLKTGD
jgi:integrase